jgi:hypothetical protein
MSFNRLGTLAAGILGLGWLAAVIINLFVWQPQLAELGPEVWNESFRFLPFVYANLVSWRFFHIGTTTGLMGLVVVIGLLSSLNREDKRWLAFTAVGLTGAILALLASLFDHLATPVLARYAQLPEVEATARSGQLIASIVWEAIEPFRDAGMKTVSYWFIGFWVIWQGGHWRRLEVLRLGQFSQILGWGLLVLAFIETMIPQPWVNIIGETGYAGFVVLLFPIWGLWTAAWFWGQEVAEVEDEGVTG